MAVAYLKAQGVQVQGEPTTMTEGPSAGIRRPRARRTGCPRRRTRWCRRSRPRRSSRVRSRRRRRLATSALPTLRPSRRTVTRSPISSDLLEPVRDVDDAGPGLERADDLEQPAGLAVGQRRRRLVHDHDPASSARALASRPSAAARPSGSRPASSGRSRARARERVGASRGRARRSGRQQRAARGRGRYSRRRSGWGPGELLVDDARCRALCAWRGLADRTLPVDAIRPSSRRRRRQDLHQRGLAGAVLAEQHMDLAAPHVERDPIQRVHAGEPLFDTPRISR